MTEKRTAVLGNAPLGWDHRRVGYISNCLFGQFPLDLETSKSNHDGKVTLAPVRLGRSLVLAAKDALYRIVACFIRTCKRLRCSRLIVLEGASEQPIPTQPLHAKDSRLWISLYERVKA